MGETELIAKARAGDGDAFRELIELHRRELQTHCYRMLGSLHDAEDALQDTLLAAWQGLGAFEGRSTFRTWLYRIATNRCLNRLRTTKRRGPKEWDIPGVEPPEPTGLNEVVWLEPFPDALLGPELRYERSEAISLAFVTALQLLPARQRAVLILREVLDYRASEVADMLDTTVESVNSALKRARATLQAHKPTVGERGSAPAPNSPQEQACVAKFVRAYQSGDIDALVAMLTDDVCLSMPPIPFEYTGRDAVGRFYARLIPKRPYELVPTRANGQPALVAYLHAPDGTKHQTGMAVLTLRGDKICAITRFETGVLPWFGLSQTLT